MELGTRIKNCMENPVDKSKHHKTDVISTLKDGNWVDENGYLRASALLETVPKFLKGKFPEARLEALVSNEAQLRTTLTALMSPRKAVAPIWCVLLRWFGEQVSYSTAPRPASAPIKSRPDRPVPLKETVITALAEHRTLKATAAALNIQQAVLSAYCDAHDIAVAANNRKRRPNMDEVKKDCSIGMSAPDLASKYKVSLSQAYRWRTALADKDSHRESEKAQSVAEDLAVWNLARSKNPAMSTQQLRQLLPKEYARLQRNDKAKFDQHKPPPPKLPKRKSRMRSPQVVGHLKGAVESMLEKNSQFAKMRRLHMSTYRIQKDTGVSAYALKTCENEDLVPNAAESREAFTVGRLFREATARQALRDAITKSPKRELRESLDKEQLKYIRRQFAEAPEAFAKRMGQRASTIRKVLDKLPKED